MVATNRKSQQTRPAALPQEIQENAGSSSPYSILRMRRIRGAKRPTTLPPAALRSSRVRRPKNPRHLGERSHANATTHARSNCLCRWIHSQKTRIPSRGSSSRTSRSRNRGSPRMDSSLHPNVQETWHRRTRQNTHTQLAQIRHTQRAATARPSLPTRSMESNSDGRTTRATSIRKISTH